MNDCCNTSGILDGGHNSDCPKYGSPTIPDWEKEFAQGLMSSEAAGGFCRVVNNTPVIQSDLISAFITKLLTQSRLQYRQELVEKLQSTQWLKNQKSYHDYDHGMMIAIGDVLEILKD